MELINHEAVIIKLFERVCLSVCICPAPPYIATCSLSGRTVYFQHYLINGTMIFENVY